MERQNVRRIDEKIGTEIFAFGVAGNLAGIGLQLLLARAPSKVGVRLVESELCERLHDFGPGKRLGEKDHAGIDGLDLSDQPFPELKWLSVRVVDSKNTHALSDPEQHDVAQCFPKAFIVRAVKVRIDDIL